MLRAMQELDGNHLARPASSAALANASASSAALADASGAQSRLPLLLEGRRLVVTGVATRASIAFAVADLAQQLGAEVVLTSFGRIRRLTERAAHGLSRMPDIVELDVTQQSDFTRLHAELELRWGRVDGAVHAIAFAPPDAIGGDFLATPAESAELAFRTSAYSLQALAACLAPLMPAGASIVGLDFDAARAWPGYNWMGVAKAALESVSRYLALELGARGIRVNLVSAGPLKTIAAGGLPAFEQLADMWAKYAPLGWDPRTPEVVAGSVCFLLSDLARGVTGEILHVDGGLHAVSGPASISAEG
jgi:meromycolic acid enoyl-[acyl-carrier-protein] reductase